MKTPQNTTPGVIRISFGQMELEFIRVLTKLGFTSEKAKVCAQIFSENTLDGVATHGVNRFSRFIEYIKNGQVQVHAEPTLQHQARSIEQWDGQIGPGILNALACTERVMKLAQEYGMGCVALRNTNHWMRGGTYAWKAAKAGYIFIGWTNTIANMPAWGAIDCHLGNNPFVLGVPYNDEAVVLDMAMSQFSYGTMEATKLRGEQLKVPGGFDANGKLTSDPSSILETRRALPIGYWKGSGLALLLDILATILSAGKSTAEISKNTVEYALSQVFIAIDISQLRNYPGISKTVNSIIEDYKNSKVDSEFQKVLYPGERVVRLRAENFKNGIPVERTIWEEIQNL
jgi:3-dehydro-L-gulonate 2-dehydrogenase